jgi:hypothetical protein
MFFAAPPLRSESALGPRRSPARVFFRTGGEYFPLLHGQTQRWRHERSGMRQARTLNSSVIRESYLTELPLRKTAEEENFSKFTGAASCARLKH